MAEQDVDADRVSVRTYVPRYQRDEWDDHATELDMSRSEFVRTMVQAGRRGLLDGPDVADEQSVDDESGGVDMERRVVDVLDDEGYLSWEDLFEKVTGDIESRLETTLQDLQAADSVRYSGPNGGYTLDE